MKFIIREAQIRTLSDASRSDFQRRLGQHLMKYFPNETKAMTETGIRTFIDGCIQSAKKYRLTTEQSIAYFSHLPLLLGADFQTNSRCRFATAILEVDTAAPPEERVKVAMLLAHQLRARGVI